jgi:ethanolamine transporter EutH
MSTELVNTMIYVAGFIITYIIARVADTDKKQHDADYVIAGLLWPIIIFIFVCIVISIGLKRGTNPIVNWIQKIFHMKK